MGVSQYVRISFSAGCLCGIALLWSGGMIDMLYGLADGSVIALSLQVMLDVALFFVAGLLGIVAGNVLDVPGKPRHRVRVRVTGREFVPAHEVRTLTYQPALKMALPSTVDVPAEWVVHVGLEGVETSVSVAKDAFDRFREGNVVEVVYSRRWLSGSIYVRSLDVPRGRVPSDPVPPAV